MLTAEPTPVCGTYHHVQVVQIRRGPKRKEVLVFYGRIATLTWDPSRFQWGSPTGGHSSHVVLSQVRQKSPSEQPRDPQSWSKEVVGRSLGWVPLALEHRVGESQNLQVGLLWLLWHYAIAVNMWRGRINHTLAIQCSVCPRRVDESVLHRLWKCPSAQRAWQWAHPSVKSTCARDEREWAMAAPFMEAWSIFKQHPAQV